MEIILFFGSTRSESILEHARCLPHLVASRTHGDQSPDPPARRRAPVTKPEECVRSPSCPSQTLAPERTKQGAPSFCPSPSLAPVLSCFFLRENPGMLLQLGRPARSREGQSGRPTHSELKRWIDVGGVRGRHQVPGLFRARLLSAARAKNGVPWETPPIYFRGCAVDTPCERCSR